MALRTVALTATLFLALPLLAHHPFSVEFDWKKPVAVTGTVSKVDWANPHAHIFLDSKDAGGKTVKWEFELGGLNALTRAGWQKTTVKNGDSITIEGWQSKSRADEGNAKSVKLSNGRELSAASSIADPVTTETSKANKVGYTGK